MEKSWYTNPRGSKDAKRKDTIVRKFVGFVDKAIPPNAVYSSDEQPPKDAVVYQTDQNKDYWIRPPRTPEKASVKEPHYWQDNPYAEAKKRGWDTDAAEEWLEENPKAMTAKAENVELNTSDVISLPGQRGEEAWEGKAKEHQTKVIEQVADNMKKHGFDYSQPVQIDVEQNGKALIHEGNKRVRAAHMAGIRNIPVEVRYYGGSEESDKLEESWKPENFHSGIKKSKDTIVRKEGDGGGDGGGFGEGGGTVFTSANAGIFTPTHSERGRGRQKAKKKNTGIERLGDYLTDNSPERKMVKGDSFTVELINWVRDELRKEDKKHFRQQTSGETINNQPPRIDWKKGNKEMPKEDGYSEYDAKPDKMAAIEQDDQNKKIKRLDDEKDSEDPKDTGSAGQASPAGLTVQLGWESGGDEADELHRGGGKDKLSEEPVEDPEDEHQDDDFIRKVFKELNVDSELMDELNTLIGSKYAK